MNFDLAFERLIGYEGGYVDHPSDPGGKTRFGVTERVARANGYTGDMRELPIELAKRIAFEGYWKPAGCEEWPEAIRYDVFDLAYHSNVGTAIKLVQHAVGVEPDGITGPRTRAAVAAIAPAVLHAKLNGARLAYLTDLPGWETFGKGWARRVAANLAKDVA